MLSPRSFMVYDGARLARLNNEFPTLNYADDLVVIIRTQHDEVLAQLVQEAIHRSNKWDMGGSLGPIQYCFYEKTRNKSPLTHTRFIRIDKLYISPYIKRLGVGHNSQLWVSRR